jgi:hypothetical protein
MKAKNSLIVVLIILTAEAFLPTPAYSFDFSTGEIAKKAAEAAKKAGEAAKKAIEEEIAKQQVNQEEEKKRQEEVAREQEAQRQREEERIREEEARRNFSVDNSAVEINLEMPEEAVQGMVQIKTANFAEQSYFPVENRQMKGTVYLRKGQGEYSLAIFYSVENRKNAIYNSLSKLNMRVQNLDTRNMEYLLPSTLVQSNDSRIQLIAADLTAGIESDKEKIKKIHDYVAGLITYNMEGFLTGSYKNDPFDAVSVLDRPFAVCSGYANLFAAISRAAGFRVRVVNGQANGVGGWGEHAWNEILVDNEWKIVDVTWDDTAVVRYKYFFPSELEFSQDHKKYAVLED